MLDGSIDPDQENDVTRSDDAAAEETAS